MWDRRSMARPAPRRQETTLPIESKGALCEGWGWNDSVSFGFGNLCWGTVRGGKPKLKYPAVLSHLPQTLSLTHSQPRSWQTLWAKAMKCHQLGYGQTNEISKFGALATSRYCFAKPTFRCLGHVSLLWAKAPKCRFYKAVALATHLAHAMLEPASGTAPRTVSALASSPSAPICSISGAAPTGAGPCSTKGKSLLRTCT